MKTFPIQIVRKKISADELGKLAHEGYGTMIKFVVDLARKILAAGGEMHYDAEQVLLEDGSEQKDLWGANLYLYRSERAQRIEFFSLINIRPRAGNRSSEIQDSLIREKVQHLVEQILLSPSEILNPPA